MHIRNAIKRFLERRVTKFVEKPFLPRRFFKVWKDKKHNLVCIKWKNKRYQWAIRKDSRVRNRRSNYYHIKWFQIGNWKFEKLEWHE